MLLLCGAFCTNCCVLNTFKPFILLHNTVDYLISVNACYTLPCFVILVLQDKKDFTAILKKISHILKTNGRNYIVLREEYK